MPMTPGDFCTLYFNELHRLSIPYVILHSRETLSKGIPSDVDYAVPTEDLPKLASIQRALAERNGWRLAQVIEAHIYSLYTVVIDPSDPRAFVQLDACGHYVECGCFLIPDAVLLQDRVSDDGLFVCSPATEFVYRLAKALAEGRPLAPRLARLQELWQREPKKSEANFRRLVGPTEGDLDQWFKKSPAQWEGLRPRFLERNRFGLADKFREMARGWRRMTQPEGLHLAWLGREGSGGPVVPELVGLLIQGAFFRGQCAFRFRPGPSECSRKDGPERPSAGEPHRGRLAAAAALLCQVVVYLARYCVEVFPAKVRNKLVVSGGSPDDLPLDPGRYGIGEAGWLARLLRRLLPQADLTMLVVAEPEQIHSRRPEIPLEELRRQRAMLQRLAQDQPGYALISSEQPPEEMARAAWREAIRFLVERERRRCQS